jgi:putative SOS response-associated peptidase YedK
MCGRFSSTLSAEFLARLFRADVRMAEIHPSWNIAPSQETPVVRRLGAGRRSVTALRWGLVPHFTRALKDASKPINARAETVASSAMFRSAFLRRRCLVPASLFYEWRQGAEGRQPYAVARADGAPLALGGIWEGWLSPEGEPIRSFAIVTTPANAEMRALHDRMPVVLAEADWADWLGETDRAATALLRPAPDGTLTAWPVSTRVNSPANNDPGLIVPIAMTSKEAG